MDTNYCHRRMYLGEFVVPDPIRVYSWLIALQNKTANVR
jgi:hypothetical protein